MITVVVATVEPERRGARCVGSCGFQSKIGFSSNRGGTKSASGLGQEVEAREKNVVAEISSCSDNSDRTPNST